MDPISQGALGAALAASVGLRRRAPVRDSTSTREAAQHVPLAIGLGAVAGMAPDLDVLIRSSADPLLFLDYHRQFTHALSFAPVGALLCALVLNPLARRRLPFRRTYLFCLLGYGSHGLLDACTSYGTQLLWPLSNVRVAWNDVSVVDPLFTLPVLALLAVGLLRRQRRLAQAALAWAVLYLGFGAIQGERAQQAGLDLAESRGHRVERLLAKPSFGNLLVWKVVYQAAGRYYVDAVRLAREITWFPGTSIASLDTPRALPWLEPGSRQATDLARFRRFSDGWLAVAPDRAHAVIDVRYSLIPNEIDPLWGIALNPAQQHEHARFFTDRATSRRERQALLDMLSEPGLPVSEAHRPTPVPDWPAQSHPSWRQPSPSRQPSLQ